jgi:dTDP-3,4-didehydro-2,6-dideoxy-alpha-D-glucose 3-reductase
MRKINLGVLGCASIAKREMLPAFLASDRFKLVAVASRSMAKAQAFAMEFNCEPIEGYQKILERPDIEAVYIPLPTGMHYEWIMAALHHGKHVIAEKSLADSFAGVKEIVALARKKSLVVCENFMFLYHSQLTMVNKMVTDGKIGHVHLLRSSFGFSSLNADDIRFQRELGGGSLLDVGTYTLKAAQYFLGNDLTVTSGLLKYCPTKGVDVGGAAMLANGRGQVAQIGFGFEHHYQCALELWGSKGRISMERIFTANPTVTPKIRVEDAGGVLELVAESDNHFVKCVSAFAADILEETAPDHGAELLNQARLLDQIKTSSGLIR